MRKPRTRAGMISYLSTHYTYKGRPARCVKINRLAPTWTKLYTACFAALDDEAALDVPNFHLDMFNQAHDMRFNKFWIEWQGRSNSHLVLKSLTISSCLEDPHEDWTTSDLHWMTGIVWDFDKACERAIKSFLDYAERCHMKEDESGASRHLR